ncbi:twin-arginine translocase subunit TatC [Phycisphaerales bacterium]|nr:twin-arginine translocase subunit TatC [Phycisphaerales bacterium]RPG16477.1 MAG: preprotein translocase subunit TatC [Phycisphaera sp. TMED9]
MPLPHHLQGLMSFGDHLEELRKRLILAAIVPLPLAVLLFFFASAIRSVLVLPALAAMEANGLPARLQALGPAEVLTTDLKLSFIGAAVISAPWILWQAWKFVEPGLYNQEKRFVYFLIPGSAILTAAGLALLYWVMLPLMLQVLISFGVPGPADAFGIPDSGTRIVESNGEGFPVFPVLEEMPANPAPGQAWIEPATRTLVVVVPTSNGAGTFELLSMPLSRAGTISQEFRLGEYIGFVLTLALAVTVAFQMPLVILLLGWAGIADRKFLTSNRRYAVLVCAILGAILTPADVVSMVLLFVPLYLLYELGILLLLVAPAERVAGGKILSSTLGDVLGRADDDSRTFNQEDSVDDAGESMDQPVDPARPDVPDPGSTPDSTGPETPDTDPTDDQSGSEDPRP